MAKAKKTSKKKNNVKSKAAEAPKKNWGSQILGISLFFLAVAFVIALFFNIGAAGAWIKSVLLGLFGFSAYLLPIIMVVSGVYAVFPKTSRRAIKLVCGAIMFVALCSVFALFSRDGIDASSVTSLLTTLYTTSNETLLSGGVIGGLLGYPLSSGIGVVLSALIFAFVFVVSLVLYFDISVAAIISKIWDKIKAKRAAKKEAAKETSQAQAEEKPKKKNMPFDESTVNIDIPIDDEPEKKPLFKKKKRSAIDIPLSDEERPPFEPDGFDISDNSRVAPEDTERVTVTAEEKAEMIKEIEAKAKLEKPAEKPYRFPPITLLTKGNADNTDATAEMRQMADKIVSTLASFGVETRITNVSRGPSITRFELVPGMGVKISKIANLSNDLALALAASRVRIEAPIPGKAAIGIEVPNKSKTTVYMREILSSREFSESKSFVTAALGKDIGGSSVVMDIAKMPHLLIAGATGSGKSVCINAIIVSLIYKASPDKVKLIMIDPKMVELSDYNGIPHLMIPVVTDPKKAAGALCWAVAEMQKRYQLFADNSVREIFSYNALAETDPDLEPLPQIVIVIDELNDLMMTAPKEVEDSICRLAQKARAAGMYLIVATQRPSADVITGLIKTNIPSRIAFAVASRIDSGIILDQTGAEKLIGQGDMLYHPMGSDKCIRAQGCFIPDKDIAAVISFIKENGTANYDDSVMREIEKQVEEREKGKGDKGGSSSGDSDPMIEEAIEIAIDARTVSTSMLQRRLKLGYGRAARIIDEMEERGIVGPPEGSKPRQVLLTKAEWAEIQMRQADIAEMNEKV
ncbi:MAG: DNA translocase FtsK [Clostridia bacterium]|nr:DNA translocase FtsK [Clostridia bacterium]